MPTILPIGLAVLWTELSAMMNEDLTPGDRGIGDVVVYRLTVDRPLVTLRTDIKGRESTHGQIADDRGPGSRDQLPIQCSSDLR